MTFGLSAEQFDIRPIYILGSVAFLVLGLIIIIFVSTKSKRNYHEQVLE